MVRALTNFTHITAAPVVQLGEPGRPEHHRVPGVHTVVVLEHVLELMSGAKGGGRLDIVHVVVGVAVALVLALVLAVAHLARRLGLGLC